VAEFFIVKVTAKDKDRNVLTLVNLNSISIEKKISCNMMQTFAGAG
jgi:hypothetical protein